MKLKNRTLKRANQYLLQGQLTKAIQILEPKISLFLDNADYFYLLGRAYFCAGDIENAKLYLNRGLENNPKHEEILLMQACLAMKNRDTYNAIATWLRLENSGCRYSCLKYGLRQVRKMEDPEALYNFTRSRKFAKLFPSLPGYQKHRNLQNVRYIVLILSIVVSIWLIQSQIIPYVQYLRKSRQHNQKITLKGIETEEYIDFNDLNARYQLSSAELEDLTHQIRKNYDQHLDNVVQRDLNRIFYSNASNQVKTKFKIVESLLEKPEIHTLKNNFTFAEVSEDPYLYQNCYIIWEGKATNFIISNGKIQFILLVGYIDGSLLEGQVQVLLEELISLPSNEPLRIFGKIKIFQNSEFQNTQRMPTVITEKVAPNFWLQAKTVNPINRPNSRAKQ